METLIAGLAGVIVGAVIENIAYFFKRKSEKMVELSDDLVELLMNLESLYRHCADRTKIDEKQIAARRLLVRILRYRQSFWQRAYNKSLFDDLDRIEQFEAPPQMTDFFGNGKKTHPVADWYTTCNRRAEMVVALYSKIEKINPFF